MIPVRPFQDVLGFGPHGRPARNLFQSAAEIEIIMVSAPVDLDGNAVPDGKAELSPVILAGGIENDLQIF